MIEWISVEDQLPAKEQEVLVVCKFSVVCMNIDISARLFTFHQEPLAVNRILLGMLNFVRNMMRKKMIISFRMAGMKGFTIGMNMAVYILPIR